MFAGDAYSISGNRYGDLNQDNFVIVNGTENNDEDGCWSVFDGHGMLGEYASRIAASTIELLLTSENNRLEGQTIEEELACAFIYAHQNICASYNVAPKEYTYGKYGEFTLKVDEDSAFYVNKENPSDERVVEYGTTAVTAWKRGSVIAIGWCGDSQAVIGGLTREGDPTSLQIEELTPKIHTINNQEEKSRIMKEGRSNPEISVDGESVRIGNTVLDMTRALGHFLLLPTPTVTSFEMEEHHQVLILASDGVWDHLSMEDAVKIALENEEAYAAAKEIVDAACGLNRDPKDQDNATAVVVYFDLVQE